MIIETFILLFYLSLTDFSPVSPLLDAERIGRNVPTWVADSDTAFHFKGDPESDPAHQQVRLF
jgi:hypothetical protein